jgi:hypothetical protein
MKKALSMIYSEWSIRKKNSKSQGCPWQCWYRLIQELRIKLNFKETIAKRNKHEAFLLGETEVKNLRLCLLCLLLIV